MKHFAILLLALLAGAAWAIPPDAPSDAALGKEDQQPAIASSGDQQDSGNQLAPSFDVPPSVLPEIKNRPGEQADAKVLDKEHTKREQSEGLEGEPTTGVDKTTSQDWTHTISFIVVIM